MCTTIEIQKQMLMSIHVERCETFFYGMQPTSTLRILIREVGLRFVVRMTTISIKSSTNAYFIKETEQEWFQYTVE